VNLTGCIVTIDAIGCQREIAQQIVNQGGDYLLSVKENQKQLYDDIKLFFKLAQPNDFAKVNHTYQRTVDNNHGRLEIRQCWAISGEESLAFLRADGHCRSCSAWS
jgi:predicted transposase YbfD/YdcC